MGFSCDSELRHMSSHCHEAKKPFVYQMTNGCVFRIDSISVDEHAVLKRRFRDQYSFEVKFVTIDDPEIEGTEFIDQYQLKFFPMYDRHDDEITHESMSEDGSVLNGNLTITDGKIEKCSTNYVDLDYREIQMPVLKFAEEYLERILESH